jgi:predicted metal-dependent peptidase
MPDDLNQLKKAREALIRERRNRAATIVSTSGSIGDAALDALIKVQEAIEVIDLAIEDLRYEEEDLDEDE